MVYEEVLKSFFVGEEVFDVEKTVFGSGSPVCTILAGVHGDEVLGRNVAERFIDILDDKELKGSVQVITRANPFACSSDTRLTPWPKFERNEGEVRDLNRCFKAAKEGIENSRSLNITQLVAKSLLEDLKNSDVVLDLHNATSGGKKVAQARYKVSKDFSSKVVEVMERLARSTVSDFIMESDTGFVGGSTVSSILPLYKVPVITFEVAGGSTHIEEDFFEYIKLVENVLVELGIFGDGKKSSDGHEKTNEPTVFHGIRSMYSGSFGYFKPTKSLGESVEKGDVVGKIFDRKGAVLEKVTTSFNGFIESLCDEGVLNEGNRIANIGVSKKDLK